VAIRKYKEAEGVLAMAYIRKAQQMWEESQIQQSAAYIEKVRGVAGDNPNLMFALGQFYETAAIRGRDRSMRQKAVEAYRRALELDPKYKEAELALERLSPRT
jgi:tetratricopeptide (TPR) repeat protein